MILVILLFIFLVNVLIEIWIVIVRVWILDCFDLGLLKIQFIMFDFLYKLLIEVVSGVCVSIVSSDNRHMQLHSIISFSLIING